MRTVTLALAAALAAAGCSEPTTRPGGPSPLATPQPFALVIGADGNPVPGSTDRLLVDTRTALQQATTLQQAWALFPGNDHSPARPWRGAEGWSFTTDFDGAGTHALRADWNAAGTGCADGSIRIINYLPTPRPRQLYVQWKQRLGRTARDSSANGRIDIFRTENANCPTSGRYLLRALRDGVNGGSDKAASLWWSGSPRQPALEQAGLGGLAGGNQGWTFLPQQNVARTIVTTLYLQAESAAGANDGAVRMWIDGRLYLERAGLALGANAFDRFQFPDWFGAPAIDQAEYFWDVVAWEPAQVPAATVARVDVSPASASIAAGGTVQLTASAYDRDGVAVSGRTTSWSSSAPAIATVSSTGLVTGVAAGSATISATVDGTSGAAAITVTSASPAPSTGCANPQPGWLWCDDFEQDRTGSYFEYAPVNGSFVRQAGAGLGGSTSMRARWAAGQVNAGSLKLAFGRTPDPYFRAVDGGTANYREVFWRIYVRSQAGWRPNGNDKFTRAVVFARSDWSEAAIGHVWGGGDASTQDYYVLDPVRGTDAAGTLQTSGYNDFAHFTWLGAARGRSPVFGAGAGQWYCVEAHMRLNDPGQSNGTFDLWVNDTLDAQRTGLNWLGSFTTYGINALFLENYLNNGAAQAQVRDYDALVVSTQRIGCAGQAPPPPPPAPVASVSVSLAASQVTVGQGTQATATLRDANGNALSGRAVSWMSSDPGVATVSSSGGETATVTSVAAGSANIIATSEGVSGQATLVVQSPPPATAASVTVSPASLSLATGGSSALTVTVRDANGNVLTGKPVTWQSSNAGVASLSNTSASGATVNAVSQGSATITATVDAATGSATVTVTAPPPPATGVPAPAAGATILLDLRRSLQQATTIDQAFGLFGIVDHTPYRGARNTGGWSFTTNADGSGLHAFRADWEASASNDQGIKIIHYLPSPKPAEVYMQWKGRIGRYAFDTDGNGAADSYAVYPQSTACKRALFSSTSGLRLDYTLHRSIPEVPKLEVGPANYVSYGDPNIWNFNSEVAGPPFTTTVYLRAATATGRNDGIFRLWIDGTLVMDLRDVPAAASTFDRWEFPTTCTAVPQPQSEYFWDILVWRP